MYCISQELHLVSFLTLYIITSISCTNVDSPSLNIDTTCALERLSTILFKPSSMWQSIEILPCHFTSIFVRLSKWDQVHLARDPKVTLGHHPSAHCMAMCFKNSSYIVVQSQHSLRIRSCRVSRIYSLFLPSRTRARHSSIQRRTSTFTNKRYCHVHSFSPLSILEFDPSIHTKNGVSMVCLYIKSTIYNYDCP